jgi:glycosyltransferase involved in cell wall biosynthesis
MGNGGGAGRAATRLHQSLRELGVDSHMLVFVADAEADPFIHETSGQIPRFLAEYMKNIDKLPNKLFGERPATTWSNNWAPNLTRKQLLELEPDIIHLHAVGGGVLPIRDFPRLQRPIVWTLHDLSAFTGGCHYSAGCDRYRQQCGHCPCLGSRREADLSRRNWKRKCKAWKRVEMRIVCPSHWLAGCSRQSSLLGGYPINVIANGIDLECFRPYQKSEARAALGLRGDCFLIAFGAASLSDSRKGLGKLVDALQIFEAQVPEGRFELITFGAGDWNSTRLKARGSGFGSIRDDRELALIYSAADVFCAPSLEENLATTAIEALACGTPVLAFRIGGFPDIVEHRTCGFLAESLTPASLAAGLGYFYQQQFARDPSGMCAAARRRAEEHFDTRMNARRYAELYEQTFSRSNEHRS